MDLPVMPPVAPMLAKLVRDIPDTGHIEPKWDGFRAVVFRDGDEVVIGSRSSRPLTRYFPEMVAALRATLPERCVVDGELVVDAGPAEEQDEAVAQALLLEQVDQRRGVLFVAVPLGDDLAHQDGVGAEGLGPLRDDLRLRNALDRVTAEVKRIPRALAEAREAIWTPEKEQAPTDTKLWTPTQQGKSEGAT